MVQAQTNIDPKLQRWYQKEFYNRSCPLRGNYSAGSGEKMQMYYYHNIVGKKDFILWMGEKTWLSPEQMLYDLNDGGTGSVTMMCKVGRSTSNGREPSILTSNTLKVTYHISGWRTREITLHGFMYMRTGTQSSWMMTYRKK